MDQREHKSKKDADSSVGLKPLPKEKAQKNESFSGQTVFLTGATGFVGKAVLRHLLYHGYAARCLVREKSLHKLESTPDVTPVIGDFLDPGSYRESIDGVHAVINLIGIESEIGGITFEDMHVRALKGLLDAMEARQLRRIIHVSLLGAGRRTNIEPFRSKGRGEDAVVGSNAIYTIFRPAIIHGPNSRFIKMLAKYARKKTPVPIVGTGQNKLQPVFVGDVAEVIVDALARRESQNKTYELAGPDEISYDDLVDIFFRETLGRTTAKLYIPKCCANGLSCILHLCGTKTFFTRESINYLTETGTADTEPLINDFKIKLRGFGESLAQYKQSIA